MQLSGLRLLAALVRGGPRGGTVAPLLLAGFALSGLGPGQ